MESLELTENVCRICLEHNERINWNNKVREFCGTSFRDCYYKYTQLQEPDPDYYPKNVCVRCANEIKNAHILFEKALESFNILQSTFEAYSLETENIFLKTYDSSQGSICDSFGENCFLDDKTHLNINEVICYSPVYEEPSTENELNGILYETDFEPINIPFEEQSYDDSYYKIMKNSVDKETNLESLETTIELNVQLEIHGTKLLKSLAIKEVNKPKALKSFLNDTIIKQTNQCIETSKGIQDSSSKLLSPKNHVNIDLQKDFDADVLEEFTIEPLDESLVEIKCKQNTDNTKRLKARERLSQSVYTKSEQNEKPSRPATDSLLRQSSTENIKNNSTRRRRNKFKTKKLEIYLSDNSAEESESPSKEEVYALLEELCGSELNKNGAKKAKPQKTKEVMCQYCSKVFISNYKAIEHEKTHLKDRERNETCSKCGLKFYNKNALRSHMYTHADNREKTLKCEFCGKTFYNNNGLSVHLKIHVGPRIPCSVCKKEYYRQSDLDKHMITHSVTRVNGDLKYKKKYFVFCKICGKEVRSIIYKSHIARHKNEPLAKCAICSKEFYSRSSCNKHLTTVHKKKTGERSKFVISYKTKYFSKLFLEQSTGTLFTKQ